jgi:hypothetical protein
MKWAVGWMPDHDVVILYSSDLGSRAYRIESGRFVEVEAISKEQRDQARKLYEDKYD